ncbi:hypothetical protein BDK51DRAFT_32376, partial [Blyttiomyces helicus]
MGTESIEDVHAVCFHAARPSAWTVYTTAAALTRLIDVATLGPITAGAFVLRWPPVSVVAILAPLVRFDIGEVERFGLMVIVIAGHAELLGVRFGVMSIALAFGFAGWMGRFPAEVDFLVKGL